MEVGKREILSQSGFPDHQEGKHAKRLCLATLDVLQKRTTDNTLKAYTVKIMTDRTKSFEYTRKVLNTLEKQVVDEIKRLGGNPILEAIVKSLSLAEISN